MQTQLILTGLSLLACRIHTWSVSAVSLVPAQGVKIQVVKLQIPQFVRIFLTSAKYGTRFSCMNLSS